MDTNRLCPGCNKPLAPDVPLGLCPECLMRSGFATGNAPESSAPPQPPSHFIPPDVEQLRLLFPQFEILELIGRGGMGAVYKARQPLLNRPVALKILARADDDLSFSSRFQREAQALAQMSHQNIVTVYDFGQADGLFYLLMEYVDGLNLRQVEQTRKLTPEQALAIVPAICDALQYAHQQGIVHRDIKPENILLDKQGRVKLADFGIAKILGTPPGERPITGEQQVIGTPHYMAPEQIEKPATVDQRADIYSLGVVFYEMLTGELPLGRFAPPSQKVQIDVRLDEIVLRALEKDPERRYQHVSDIRTQVETLSTVPPPQEPAASDPQAALWESRAPGWRVRCPKCGFTEPWGKYGIRIGAVGTSRHFGRCPNCHRMVWNIVERADSAAPASTVQKSDDSALQPALQPSQRKLAWHLTIVLLYAVMIIGMLLAYFTGAGSRGEIIALFLAFATLPLTRIVCGIWARHYWTSVMAGTSSPALLATKAAAVLGINESIACVGLASFIFSQLLPEMGFSGHSWNWHPSFEEAAITALTFLGALLLPISTASIFQALKGSAVDRDLTPIRRPRSFGCVGCLLVALGGFVLLATGSLIFVQLSYRVPRNPARTTSAEMFVSENTSILLYLFALLFAATCITWLLYWVFRTANPAKQTGARLQPLWQRASIAVLLAFGIALLIRTYIFAPYRIPTDSVSPDIPKGSLLFVNKLIRNFNRGDIVAFNQGGRILLGRVADSAPGFTTVERKSSEGHPDVAIPVPQRDIIGRVVFNTRAQARPEIRSREDAQPAMRYRIFEVDAPAADGIVPLEIRARGDMPDEDETSGRMATFGAAVNEPSQMADLPATSVTALLGNMAQPPGLLIEHTRRDGLWPKTADGDSYAHAGGNATGGINGFYGAQNGKIRLQYEVSHNGPGFNLRAHLFYQGQFPSAGHCRVFFIPFTRPGDSHRYLVAAFDDPLAQTMSAFYNATPYPMITVHKAWHDETATYPDPMPYLVYLRTTPEYQRWLQRKDDHVFSNKNLAGFRFEAHFAGMASNAESGPEELIPTVDIYRPTGEHLASMPLGRSGADRWDVKVYDSAGTTVTERLQWTRDPSTHTPYVETIVHSPGSANEAFEFANRFGVVYSNTRDQVHPEYKDAPLTATASGRTP